MREILFRGKRVDNDAWVEGYYVILNKKEHRIYTGYAETDCEDYYADYWTVDPKTVGQYTGLTDKNGKKIFEGDIIQGTFHGYKEIDVVRWLCTSGQFMFPIWDMNLEIIGNIHDNPELLKENKDV